MKRKITALLLLTVFAVSVPFAFPREAQGKKYSYPPYIPPLPRITFRPLPTPISIPITVYQPSYSYTVDGNKATITKLNDLSSVNWPSDLTAYENLLIPETLDGFPVEAIGDGAFEVTYSSGFDFVKTITIPASVKTIGARAFAKRDTLEAVTIPEGVTSIGDEAFADCTSLVSITIPASVMTIGSNPFVLNSYIYDGTLYSPASCGSFRSIDVAEGNPAYSSRDGVLFDKDQKRLIAYPAGKEDAFYQVPGTVEDIGQSAFRSCISLRSAAIPQSVTSIGENAFSDCLKLAALEVDAANPAYFSLDGVLFDRAGEHLLAYPKDKAESVYHVPEGVLDIPGRAFINCSHLVSVYIPDSVASIGSEAFLCESLTDINVSPGNAVYSCADGLLLDKQQSRLIACPPAKTEVRVPQGVSQISERMFIHCSRLVSVYLPDSVTSIGDNAFACGSLTDITVSPGNAVYSSAEGLLLDKNQSRLILCPPGKMEVRVPQGVEEISESMFFNCNHLVSIYLPDSVTSIGSGAFLLESLTDVSVSPGNPIYSSADGLLLDRQQKILLACPPGKTEIRIPESVEEIGESAFYIFGVEELTIPKNVKRIDKGAFMSNGELKTVILSSGVTSIGEEAFLGCLGLDSITIPSSVTSIGKDAFDWNDVPIITTTEGSYAQKYATEHGMPCILKH